MSCGIEIADVCKSGIEFQILAIKLEGSVLQPGTGGLIFLDSASLVFLLFSFSEKSRVPKGFIDILDFQTKTAITDAVASFKLRRPAFVRINSDRTLSESFVLVIDRATLLIDLLISICQV